MSISRRALVGAALGFAAAAAVGAVAFAGPGQSPTGAPRRGGKYHPGPRGTRGSGDMIMQLSDGSWHTHLLPFAAPFRDKASLLAELKRTRAQGLVR
jgi:hypothetical protein